jgi:class 3 adenylate cyclase
MGSSSRRLAAIMFTDVVGYTTIVAQNEALRSFFAGS